MKTKKKKKKKKKQKSYHNAIMLFQDTLDGPLHIFELENARIVQWQALLWVPRSVAETFQTTEPEYRKGWMKEFSVNALLFHYLFNC